MRSGHHSRFAILAMVCVMLASACGSSADVDDGGGGAGADSRPDPEWAGLDEYRSRCEQLDLTGARARLVYEGPKEMKRGDTETVAAAVTLDLDAPAEQVLRRSGARDEAGIVVSCNVRARLVASKYEFEIDSDDWITRSLLTADTTRWSWLVTPKIGGDQTIELQFRPIMTTRPQNPADEEFADTESFDIRTVEVPVRVSVTWDQWLNDWMSRLAKSFEVGEGLVKAISGFIVALTGVLTALGIKKRRRTRAATQPSAPHT